MSTKHIRTLTMLTLAPLLTVTLASTAQQSGTTRDMQNRSYEKQADQKTDLQFVTFKEMKGLDIHSLSEDTLGEVSDLVMECRSGRVAYVVLDYGGALGVGQKSKAVPYSAFQFDGRNDEGVVLRLDMTKTELEAAPEFDAAGWTNTDQRSWNEKLAQYWNNLVDGVDDDDEPAAWSESVRTGEKRSIDGTIVKVIRLENKRPEQVALLVETSTGEMQTVYLGPSWWVLSQNPAPAQNDRVTIIAYPLKDESNPTVVATTIRNSAGKTIVLRDDEGNPRWRDNDLDDTRSASAERNATSTAPARYCLVSDLINADVTAQTADAGHIDTVYVECSTGQIAFLGIDPDEKIADIGEVNRIVPFELVTTSNMKKGEKIQLWTDATLLTSGIETPKSADELNNASYRTSLYNHYGVNERTFKTHGDQKSAGDWKRASDSEVRAAAASADSNLRIAIMNGDPVSLNGQVTRVRSDASTDAYLGNMAIVVRTTQGEQTVHVGPSNMYEKKLDLKPGQNVEVNAVRANSNGRDFYVARSITVDGTTHELRDASGKPNWDVR